MSKLKLLKPKYTVIKNSFHTELEKNDLPWEVTKYFCKRSSVSPKIHRQQNDFLFHYGHCIFINNYRIIYVPSGKSNAHSMSSFRVILFY